ncbi:hypothetical protein [Rhodococcoides kroppenstedtii]|uniref:hypothetical protein n=1 Tax=Rhodococcoides kroppenstedtii TaxID=293050 RepID=UPI00363D6D86
MPGDPTDDRARRADTVRRIAESARIDAVHEPLSDRAALLYALGRVDDTVRSVALARLRAGRRFPAIGGFAALRPLVRELDWIEERLSHGRAGPTRVALMQRKALLSRRLGGLRTRFVMSSAHYAVGVRAIRRDRRDGLHLDVDQRTALFEALCHTPAPLGAGPGPLGRAREILGGLAADRLEPVHERGAALARSVAGIDVDRFTDRYETIGFLAGTYHDRILGARIWHTDLFAVARAQLDPGLELVGIAVDVVALATLDADLTAAFEAQGDAIDDEGRREILRRRGDLIPVWDQVIDRVAALSRVVDEIAVAEVEHRSLDVLAQTAGLDRRIEDLLGRSGDREISADNTHSVSDQISRDQW